MHSPSQQRQSIDPGAELAPATEGTDVVWLVEDSATDAYVIRDVLVAGDLASKVRVLSDGESALAALATAESGDEPRPTLVLLDLNMPKVDGLDVLRAIRNSTRCAAVPVVIVTSSDSAKDVDAIRKWGATAYFKKPHTLDEFSRLATILKRALGREP